VTSEPGRRVTAEEAAEILGVPAHLISRLDLRGEWIKRYKLTRKTHVYDVESLHAYLNAKLVKPIPAPRAAPKMKNTQAARRYVPGLPKERSSLQDLLRKQREQAKK